MVTTGKIDVNQLVQEEPLFRVHRRVYADAEIFELEMQRIFGRTWVYVAHESEIKNPGDYKATYIGRQPVIVSRFEDGSIHVLYNRCMHRASIVCRDERGNSNRFRCPYHGWTYRNDGTLIGVPYRDTYPPNFDFSQWSLLSVAQVASYQGFIFANQSPDAVGLEESLGAYKVTFDNLVDRSPTGEIELGPVAHKYDFVGNWKFQMENANDPYHGPFVHESTHPYPPGLAYRHAAQGRERAGATETVSNEPGEDDTPQLPLRASVHAARGRRTAGWLYSRRVRGRPGETVGAFTD